MNGVKVGPVPWDLELWDPGTRDAVPPQSFKVGPRTPIEFESRTPRPPSKIKFGTTSPFFNKFIFFRIFHLFFTYLIFLTF